MVMDRLEWQDWTDGSYDRFAGQVALKLGIADPLYYATVRQFLTDWYFYLAKPGKPHLSGRASSLKSWLDSAIDLPWISCRRTGRLGDDRLLIDGRELSVV